MKLYKFYDLISRNAMVTLANKNLDKTFFEGSMRDMPDEYDNYTVLDFAVSNDGDFLFWVEQGA